MRSIPGTAMRGTPQITRVLCITAGCGNHIATLPDGLRLAMRGVRATGRISGTCEKCGEQYGFAITEVAGG